LDGSVNSSHGQAIIQVRDLRKYFPVSTQIFSRSRSFVRAVDGVSFDISKQESYGLIGESGSGKTTLARLILRLIEPTSGSVYFDGQNIYKMNTKQMALLRRKMQMIFQDPLSSLNPSKTIRQSLEQPFKLHTSFSKEQIENEVAHLLEVVGLTPPESFLDRFPHELSGGQRQRVCIARAVALRPAFLIADEPVSALDVSVRAQIIRLLRRLQTESKMTYLIITHDIALVGSLCSHVLVMYLGKIVESGHVEEVIRSPLHPYTQMLLSAVLEPDPNIIKIQRHVLQGEVPSPINPPSGCHFHPRCPYATERCKREPPRLTEVDGRLVACHLYT
jgi:oligopeptide/dipeptide ABC transporter ATP-binding protein